MQISVKNLTKYYGTKKVIDNLSFKMGESKILAFVGASGIGKTTIFRILTGLDRDFEGEVNLDQDNIAVSFQENVFCEKFSIKDNINLVNKNSIDDIIIETNLHKVGIILDINEKVENLSGGMKKRLSVVRAMLSDRNIIILDEPFTGLDSKNVELVSNYIKDALDKTIIIFCHEEKDAKNITDNIIKL